MIDLHLHLDGSLSIKTMRKLSAINGTKLPENDAKLWESLSVGEECKNLNDYLEKFELPLTHLQNEVSIKTAVCDLLSELKEQKLEYAEIRFAPQLHMREGLTMDRVIEAACQGLKMVDMPAKLILCCMRGKDNEGENLETVRLAKRYLDKGVCAIDLAGAEALYPTEAFENVFSLARSLSVPYTIHAGEADGPESVKKAIEFGATRIGHGVRSVEDEKLLEVLRKKGIILELCPTSNLNTHVYEDIREYPIKRLLDAGVKVTINTDNMTVSDTNLMKEWSLIRDNFSLSLEEIRWINTNSSEGRFINETN